MQKPSKSHILMCVVVVVINLACGPVEAVRDIASSVIRGTATPTEDPSRRLYVSPEGNDENDCRTPAAPCRRINSAIDRAGPGFLILLAPGVYDEWDTIVATSVHIDKPITLRGSGAESTSIVGHDENHLVVNVNADGMVVIEDLRIEDGRSPAGVGLLMNSPVTLRGVIVQRNLCGIESSDDLVLENVHVLANRECGIFAIEGDVTIQNSLIAGNGGFGLSISEGATGTISTTTFRDNTSGQANGIVNAGTMTLRTSTISGNSGYGVYNRGELLIENSTISGNRLSGIFHFGQLSINHATIAYNGNYGLATSDRYDSLVLSNSLIVGNRPADCYLTIGWDYYTDFEGETIDSDESCRDWSAGDPGPAEIAPLADNGGPTMTHALLLGNPAIDAVGEGCLEHDQRGVLRPQGSACDAGAFEFEVFGDASGVPLSGEFPPGFPTGPTTCRTGPGSIYPPLAYFDVGDELLPLARDALGSWLQVQGKGKPPCWILRDLIEFDPAFDPMELPAGIIPPTPTWTAVPPTEKPDTGPQGCKVYNNQTQQEVCYPIAQCPVPFNQSLGACTP